MIVVMDLGKSGQTDAIDCLCGGGNYGQQRCTNMASEMGLVRAIYPEVLKCLVACAARGNIFVEGCATISSRIGVVVLGLAILFMTILASDCVHGRLPR
jgi:hypothetical protein